MVGSLNTNTDLLKTKLNDFVASTKIFRSINQNKWTEHGKFWRVDGIGITQSASVDGMSFNTPSQVQFGPPDGTDAYSANVGAYGTDYNQNTTVISPSHPMAKFLTIGPFPLITIVMINGIGYVGTDSGTDDGWTLRLIRDDAVVLAQMKVSRNAGGAGKIHPYHLSYMDTISANTSRKYTFYPRYDTGGQAYCHPSDLEIIVVPQTSLVI